MDACTPPAGQVRARHWSGPSNTRTSDMEDLTELILLQMSSLNQDAGDFVAGLLSDDLTRDQQVSFGHRLVDLAELILEHANKTPIMVIEGTLSDDDDTTEAHPHLIVLVATHTTRGSRS